MDSQRPAGSRRQRRSANDDHEGVVRAAGEARDHLLSDHDGVLVEEVQLDCERLYFAIGQYPADDLGVQLKCERDESGHIAVDDRYRTTVLNVFAAGDITPGPQLAISAAAEGAIAALAIHASLVPDSRKLD